MEVRPLDSKYGALTTRYYPLRYIIHMRRSVKGLGYLPSLDCAADSEGHHLRVGGDKRPLRAAAQQPPEVIPFDLVSPVGEGV